MSFSRGLLFSLVVCSLALAGFVGGAFWWVSDIGRPTTCRAVSLVVPPGMRSGEIATQLKNAGLIRSTLAFRFWVGLYGAGSRLRPGKYEFQGTETIERILQILLEGREERVRVTIPEGWTLSMIARGVEEANVCSGSAFLAAVSSPELLEKIFVGWPTLPSAEGLAFPETYTFSKGVHPRDVAGTMLQKTREMVEKTVGRDGRNGLTVYQACVLASLVEREGKRKDELSLIASVFYNRLKLGMRLESCATVQYVLPMHKERLTFEDLKIDSPFNTYLNPGLPPTPISNFGKAALSAVASPTQSDYLFFVSDASDGHRFATSLSEHERYRRQFFRDRRQTSAVAAPKEDSAEQSSTSAKPGTSSKSGRKKGRKR